MNQSLGNQNQQPQFKNSRMGKARIHGLYLLRAAQLIAVLFISGCVTSPTTGTSGNKLDSNKVSLIKKGVTTRSEVIALLGQPTNVTMMGEGRRMMFYHYSEMARSNNIIAVANPFNFGPPKGDQQTGRTQMLQVILDKADVVEDYEFADQTTKTDIDYKGSKVNTTTAPSETEKKK